MDQNVKMLNAGYTKRTKLSFLKRKVKSETIGEKFVPSSRAKVLSNDEL
jgi:hypothetical protein